MITRIPRCSSNVPKAAAANPFPNELTTPPVTKMYFISLWCRPGGADVGTPYGHHHRPAGAAEVPPSLKI
jgi:hypothetical protein